MFITFEGGEGSGKSSVAKALVKSINQDKNFKKEAIYTNEPNNKKIKDVLVNTKLLTKSEVLLFLADRLEHLEKIIKPALKEDKFVISDRYIHSSYAIQSQDEWDVSFIKKLHSMILKDFYPDLIFFLDSPVEVNLKRIKNRKNLNKFDKRDLEFHKKVKTILKSFCKSEKNFVNVKADKEIKTLVNELKNYLMFYKKIKGVN